MDPVEELMSITGMNQEEAKNFLMMTGNDV